MLLFIAGSGRPMHSRRISPGHGPRCRNRPLPPLLRRAGEADAPGLRAYEAEIQTAAFS